MLRSLHLQNVGPSAEMTFTPAYRLNVITGDNGLGKSFLLDLAWWAVTRTWAGRPVQPPLEPPELAQIDISFDAVTSMAELSVPFDRSSQKWRFPRGQPGEPGLVVYARVDGDFAVWDSNRRFGGVEEEETGIPKGLVFSRDAVWNGLELNGKPICNGLLADWVSWQERNTWEFAALCEALKLLSPSEEELVTPGSPTRLDANDSRMIPTLRMAYGQDVGITVASAGMKRVIALAYLLVWAWREHLEVSRFASKPTAERMLVIIDEVESHLHPKWQRVILSAIFNALKHLTEDPLPLDGQVPAPRPPNYVPPKIQYIIATHSPLVLASLEPLFQDDLDRLFELQLETSPDGRRAVVLNVPEFRRQGSAEKWLLSEAIGLTSSRSVPAEKTLKDAAQLMTGEPPSIGDMVEMEERLAGVLPDIDPFWVRWRAVKAGREGQASLSEVEVLAEDELLAAEDISAEETSAPEGERSSSSED
jgi:hypothetical protein